MPAWREVRLGQLVVGFRPRSLAERQERRGVNGPESSKCLDDTGLVPLCRGPSQAGRNQDREVATAEFDRPGEPAPSQVNGRGRGRLHRLPKQQAPRSKANALRIGDARSRFNPATPRHAKPSDTRVSTQKARCSKCSEPRSVRVRARRLTRARLTRLKDTIAFGRQRTRQRGEIA